MSLAITLYKPSILVRPTTSINGYVIQPDMIFGTVDAVNDFAEKVAAGNTVVFKLQDATMIDDGTNIYYMVDEDKLSGKEFVAP